MLCMLSARWCHTWHAPPRPGCLQRTFPPEVPYLPLEQAPVAINISNNLMCCLQGASNEVLEAELPDLPLEQRAVAINSLLQAERIQLLLNPTNNQPVYKPATSAVDNVKWVA